MMNPTTSTNGTAISVSVSALRREHRAPREGEGQPAGDDESTTAVSAMIHGGREVAVAIVGRGRACDREAASVLTSPPTTGFASVASV